MEIYRAKNREVEWSARSRDKRHFADNLAAEAQAAAEGDDSRIVYKITKTLTGVFTSKTTVVKDKTRKVLTTEEDQLSRWAEHFEETLNRQDPEEEAIIEDMDFTIEMKRGRITQQMVEAIEQTKGNWAPGEDRITADMLKADPSTSVKTLEKLFNKVWEEERVPDTWTKKGIIVKLPKKGDLSECGNWRGINLLSVPGKIFCLVLLQRMRRIDRILREDQAGFRSGRGCTYQILVLRTIVEQSIEWNSSLYVNYIDVFQ